MSKRARGLSSDGSHYFNEIIVFSTNLLHVFIRTKKNTNHVAVFVCRASANIGMVLVKSRAAVSYVETAL